MSQEIRNIVPPSYYSKHFSQIIFKTTFTNCVHRALTLRKWKELQTGQWNLQWCEKQRVNDVFNQGISSNQRVNHFRLYTQLCRKDMLMKNVRKYKRQLSKQKALQERLWSFLPSTYFLPSQYIMFVEDFKKNGGFWIMKPTSRCQGAGIFIVDRISQVAPYKTKNIPQNNENVRQNKTKKEKKDKESEESGSESEEEDNKEDDEALTNQTYIIQKYLDSPLLFGMKKFDMRIYVLCTDYRNLTVWLYRNGFARFTHEPYYRDQIHNLSGHLTNVQIQKHSENYDSVRGGKWFLRQFKHYLISKYSKQKIDQCFTQIKDIILRSLQAVQKTILPSKSSFQLYGYDFMVDSNFKPWLIEVNGGPSMTANTDLDCQLKCGLVDDVLSIIDLQGVLDGSEMTVGGFDLIMKKDVIVKQDEHYEYNNTLGAKNERKKVMKELGKRFMERKRQEVENRELQKQKQNRKRMREQKKQLKKDSKLLPSFYYEKRREVQIGNLGNLKRQLQYLQIENVREFVPLKNYE